MPVLPDPNLKCIPLFLKPAEKVNINPNKAGLFQYFLWGGVNFSPATYFKKK